MYMGSENVLKALLFAKRTTGANVDKQIHMELIGLRNRNREQEKWSDGYSKWHEDPEWGHAWAKMVIPKELSKNEIKEFKEREWCYFYNPYEDGRDCTGVWYTTFIYVFPINGKTLVYHFKNQDI